ncbi:MAG: HK97 gp10 family phage protein [Chloroflexi bacterium]|nr:HK97 gp10 family phage protein [Chloroflexota bacterium]
MGVRVLGDWRRSQERLRYQFRREMEALAEEARQELQKETPVRTGELRSRWRVRRRGRYLVVENGAPHALPVALGRHDRPMSPRERRNKGFHLRALNRVAKRIDGRFQRMLRTVF